MMDIELGKIIKQDVNRDAIHVAIAPVIASETLFPGQQISVRDNYAYSDGKTIGIVDPYLKCKVMKNDKFWIFLYPNTVTGMRHQWSHPVFDNEQSESKTPITTEVNTCKRELSSKKDAKFFISEFAGRCNLDYDEFIEIIRAYTISGGNPYVQEGGQHYQDTYNELSDEDKDYLRRCLEMAENIIYNIEDMWWPNPFSCSC